MRKIKSAAALSLLIAAGSFALAGCKSHKGMQGAAASTGTYPLTKCVVSGEDLGDKPYMFVRNGQTVKLCCKDCLAKFDQDPEKYLAKIK